MRVRISNDSEAVTEIVAVAILRPDLSPGEPGSLAQMHTLQRGESASFNLPAMATIALSNLAAREPARERPPGWFEPPSQEFWP